MTETSSTEKIVTKAVSPDGNTSYEKITQIKTYWNNMNPYFRKVIISYALISIGCYAAYNYNDGKNALIDYRLKNHLSSQMDEWNAIKRGINSTENFFSALFFPYSVAEKIMPSIILYLNPKK